MKMRLKTPAIAAAIVLGATIALATGAGPAQACSEPGCSPTVTYKAAPRIVTQRFIARAAKAIEQNNPYEGFPGKAVGSCFRNGHRAYFDCYASITFKSGTRPWVRADGRTGYLPTCDESVTARVYPGGRIQFVKFTTCLSS